MKGAKPRPRFYMLEYLVNFLNFNFDTQEPQYLYLGKPVLRTYSEALAYIHVGLSPEDAAGIRGAKEDQQKLRNDLVHVITPDKKWWEDEDEFPIKVLVRKINEMELTSEWSVEFVGQQEKVPVFDKTGKFTGDLRERLKPAYHEPSQGVMSIGGMKFYVTRFLGDQGFRKTLYLFITVALENGTFERLKICFQCGKFFVAEHLGRTYCTDECTEAADVKAAPLRVREWRKRKKAKEQKEAREREERLAFKRFSNFLALALKKRPTREDGHRMHPFMCDLGKGDPAQGWIVVHEWNEKHRRGVSINEIWRELRPQEKKVFEAP